MDTLKILDTHHTKRCSEEEYITYTHKHCNKCTIIKPVKEFYKKVSKTKRGWFWDSWCIECRNEDSRRYGIGNRERRNVRLKLWRKANPEKAKINDRRKALRQNYNMSPDDYNKMLVAQEGKCFLCRRVANYRLCVDHNHNTGQIRRLICHKCNSVLGWIESRDILGKIVEYVSEPCRADILLELSNKD